MILHTEIKDFAKKTLLLGVLLSVLLNLIFTYMGGFMDSGSVSANSNDGRFRRAGVPYLGSAGVAVALNVGLAQKPTFESPVTLYGQLIPVQEILADKGTGRNQVLSTNMVAANEYLNIIRTDVPKLLASATDRGAMLESFIDQLEYRYKTTVDYLQNLNAQITELQSVVVTTDANILREKTTLTDAYKNLDYTATEDALDRYLSERQKNDYARTYLIFLGKFSQTYTIMNQYNKILLDSLINNKEALIKNATIVLPDSGTQLLRKLQLIKTEAEWKSGN